MNRVGTVYGQSLYTLAKEENLENAVLQELTLLETAFSQQPEFLRLLSSANLSKPERLGILDDSFGGKVHLYVLNFLKLLTEKGHISQFGSCCRAYREQYNLDKGILQVRVVSAIALTELQKQRLADKLSAMTGKEICLICREDKSVLGGIRISYDGKQVDGTVQGRLSALEKSLKNTVL